MNLRQRVKVLNRGRPGKPCWTVELDGKYFASDASKDMMEGTARQLRRSLSAQAKGKAPTLREKISPTDTTCPACKEGVMFDVTPMLAQSLNQKHVQCGKCGYRHGFRIEGAA